MSKLKKEQLRPYIIAQSLRGAANRCTRVNADVAILCEYALKAAEWMESEAGDIAKLSGSVTHEEESGKIVVGCVVSGIF